MRFCGLTERVVDALTAAGPYGDRDYSLGACLMRMEVRLRALQGSLAAACVCMQQPLTGALCCC